MKKYHGIFEKLAELNIYDNANADLYDKNLADFYHRFVGDFVGDIPLFERYLGDKSMCVLDLACGSGRIGIGLGRLGYRVDGVELSQAMLSLAKDELSHEAAEVQERLRFVRGDMTAFSLSTHYDLIVIGVTSISLLLKAEERRRLFTCVAAHLKPNGRFLFDFLDFSEGRWKTHDGMEDVWSVETDEGVDFGIIGQRFYPDEQLFVFNVYRELVAWNGETTRTLGSSTKAWLDAEQLITEMEEMGLRLVDRFNLGASTYLAAGLGNAKSA
ncbi:MAG TPA: methyltransferase domain-containing protein [Granulicella sp.]